MSEFEPNPELVRTLQLAHEGMTDAALCGGDYLVRQVSTAQTPVVFLGRYLQAFQFAARQRTSASDARYVAHRKELEAKKVAEMMSAAAGGGGGNSDTPAPSTSPASTTYN